MYWPAVGWDEEQLTLAFVVDAALRFGLELGADVVEEVVQALAGAHLGAAHDAGRVAVVHGRALGAIDYGVRRSCSGRAAGWAECEAGVDAWAGAQGWQGWTAQDSVGASQQAGVGGAGPGVGAHDAGWMDGQRVQERGRAGAVGGAGEVGEGRGLSGRAKTSGSCMGICALFLARCLCWLHGWAVPLATNHGRSVAPGPGQRPARLWGCPRPRPARCLLCSPWSARGRLALDKRQATRRTWGRSPTTPTTPNATLALPLPLLAKQSEPGKPPSPRACPASPVAIVGDGSYLPSPCKMWTPSESRPSLRLRLLLLLLPLLPHHRNCQSPPPSHSHHARRQSRPFHSLPSASMQHRSIPVSALCKHDGFCWQPSVAMQGCSFRHQPSVAAPSASLKPWSRASRPAEQPPSKPSHGRITPSSCSLAIPPA